MASTTAAHQPFPSEDKRACVGVRRRYPDIFDPAAPLPLFKLHPLFKAGVLIDSKGKQIEWEELRGKSVALYFGDDSKAKCKTILPVLVNVYTTLNESGDGQKVEIIFVSLDATEKQYDNHRKRMPWLSLRFEDPLIDIFKQHYRTMNPNELPKYGYGPRIGPPALLVIASDGRLLQLMDLAEGGRNAIRKWDLVSHKF